MCVSVVKVESLYEIELDRLPGAVVSMLDVIEHLQYFSMKSLCEKVEVQQVESVSSSIDGHRSSYEGRQQSRFDLRSLS